MKIILGEVFTVVCVYLGFVNHNTENGTETDTLQIKNELAEYNFTSSQLESNFSLQFSPCCHIP